MPLPYNASETDDGFNIDGVDYPQSRVNDAGIREIHRTAGAKIQRAKDKQELEERRNGTFEGE